MLSQLEIKRQQYIQACITTATIEAEMRFNEAFGGAPEPTEIDDLCTVKDVMELTGKSESWVRSQPKRMVVSLVPGLGKTWRITRKDAMRLAGIAKGKKT